MIQNCTIGLMEAIIQPVLDVCVALIMDIISGFLAGINVFATLICRMFVDGFIIGEEMFTNNIYIALTSGEVYNSMRAAAIAVMLTIAIWQVFKTFFSVVGLNGEIEEPWKVGIKVMMFGILIMYSREVCEILIKIGGYVLNEISNISFMVEKGKVKLGQSIGDGVYKGAMGLDFGWNPLGGSGLTLLLRGLIIIYADWKLIGFMFNMVQKYFNMMVYIALAPIAFACGVSRATRDILISWSKLFAGGIAIQGMQIIVLKIIDIYGRIMGTVGKNDWTVLFIYFSLAAVMTKLESILEELGLPGGMKCQIMSTITEPLDFIFGIAKSVKNFNIARKAEKQGTGGK